MTMKNTALHISRLSEMLLSASERIVQSEAELTRLDSVIGDGDHGVGMRDGFTEVKHVLENSEFEDAYSLMREVGITLVKTMGGASGVIFGTLFISGCTALSGKQYVNADELIDFFDAGARTIAKRGRTAAGDKTMLDALLPAVEAMRKARVASDDVEAVMNAAYEGACAGAEATKGMISRKGRSKNFREKTLGVVDPGAVSLSIIFGGMCAAIKDGKTNGNI